MLLLKSMVKIQVQKIVTNRVRMEFVLSHLGDLKVQSLARAILGVSMVTIIDSKILLRGHSHHLQELLYENSHHPVEL